ncbi:MAG: hypothetical protein JXM73_22370 [Anaerolineae bacterium]|nr:hypothetical protein [Anaerolineae bacterium]
MMIGHLAKDQVIVDGQGQTVPGGGVYYGSVALRRLGASVAVVTRLHPDDFPLLDELKQEGVRVFATPAAETSGIANYYRSNDMERRVCRPLGFAGPFTAGEIPDLPARIYAIVSIIAGEVDLSLLELLAQRGPVALDVQGFVRVRDGGDLVFRRWAEMEQGLSLVTYLKVDRAEAELLTGETDLQAAARQLSSYGPQEIVLTQSAGVTVWANGQVYQAPFTPRSLAGRTGRGDTCFASYLGWRLRASPAEAARVAAAVTTLKQEHPGPWRGALADLEINLSQEPITQHETPATGDPLQEISSYLRICDTLATAGQPAPEQFAAIRDAGYQVVINLAMPTSTNALPNEAEIVAGLDMDYVHIPVAWENPTPVDLECFFAAMNRYRGHKVFVHCAMNMRVSAFVLLYRVIRQGAPLETAKEALSRIWEPDATWQRFIDNSLARYMPADSK